MFNFNVDSFNKEWRGEGMYIGASEGRTANYTEEGKKHKIKALSSVNSKDSVKDLQAYLNNELRGYNITPDGDSLEVDGNFGPLTKKFLEAYVGMTIGESAFPGIVESIESNLSLSTNDKVFNLLEGGEKINLFEEK